MTREMLRRLLMDKVVRLGTAWLRIVLQAAGTDRISGLSTDQLRAAVEERA
jgi:hypothetical protein